MLIKYNFIVYICQNEKHEKCHSHSKPCSSCSGSD